MSISRRFRIFRQKEQSPEDYLFHIESPEQLIWRLGVFDSTGFNISSIRMSLSTWMSCLSYSEAHESNLFESDPFYEKGFIGYFLSFPVFIVSSLKPNQISICPVSEQVARMTSEIPTGKTSRFAILRGKQ